MAWRNVRRLAAAALAALLAAACGDDASSPGPTSESGEPDCPSYDSTFEALQVAIFERHGCTAAACHGQAVSGGLDLRPEVAYEHLVDVPSSGSPYKRIEPGAPASSFLFDKLRAATDPGSVAVAGSPMPVAGAPLSADELEAVRVWIAAGAPKTGAVGDPRHLSGSSEYVSQLLGVCLPESQLVQIRPLDPPAPEEGIQLEMPVHTLAAATEWEGCFASYFDFGDRVPERFQSPDGESFYVNGTVIRQDAASHHLVILDPGLGPESVHHPALEPWTCHEGPRDGEGCEPFDPSSCGEGGICASPAQDGVACLGFGPPQASFNPAGFGLGTALQAQVTVAPVPGAYRLVPIRGLVYWDLHAFNLTTEDVDLHARMNLLYATDRRFEETHTSIGGPIPPVAPFTKQETCGTWAVPQGATLIRLSSHTHRHGEHFWVDDPAGNRLYDSFYYSDPTYLVLDPPLVFDTSVAADRRLTFCVLYNNGLGDDGTPDLDLVTRRSRTPPTSTSPCRPIACTAGRVGESCTGVADDAACDSSPGAGDGVCDACAIQPGLTTEDEMFFLLPDLFLPPTP